MFTCIRCMTDLPDEQKSEEHILPYSLGGSLVMRDHCTPCNSIWGRVIDVPLVDHFLCQLARNQYEIAGRDGHIPNPVERGTLVAEPTTRVRTGMGLSEGAERPPFFEIGRREVTLPDGRRAIQFHGDRRHEAEVIAAANRFQERALRRGQTIERHEPGVSRFEFPEVMVPFVVDLDLWRAGMLKIAYELAYHELGRSYLDDEVACEIRARLQTTDLQPGIANGLRGTMGIGAGKVLMPSPRTWHRLTLLTIDEKVVADIRIFDVLHFTIVVSDRTAQYPDFAEFATYLLDARRRRWHPFFGDFPEDYRNDLRKYPVEGEDEEVGT